MAQTTYTNPQRELLTGLDNVIIPKFIAGINGGRTLDVSAWNGETIPAGVAIITDGNGAYKPMPVASGAYSTLPENWAYAGILACSVLKSRPAASIMTAGQVNEIAAKPSLAAIKAAIKAALPGIEFVKDENSAAE